MPRPRGIDQPGEHHSQAGRLAREPGNHLCPPLALTQRPFQQVGGPDPFRVKIGKARLSLRWPSGPLSYLQELAYAVCLFGTGL